MITPPVPLSLQRILENGGGLNKSLIADIDKQLARDAWRRHYQRRAQEIQRSAFRAELWA